MKQYIYNAEAINPLKRLSATNADSVSGAGVYTQLVNVYTITSDDIVAISNLTAVQLVSTQSRAGGFLSDGVAFSATDTGVVDVFNSSGVQYVHANEVGQDNVDNIGKITTGATGRVNFVVALGTFANLAAAKTALTGTIVWYKLTAPITTQLEIMPKLSKTFKRVSLKYDASY